MVRSLVSKAFVDGGLDAPRVGIVSVSMHLRLALLATGKYISTISKLICSLRRRAVVAQDIAG